MNHTTYMKAESMICSSDAWAIRLAGGTPVYIALTMPPHGVTAKTHASEWTTDLKTIADAVGLQTRAPVSPLLPSISIIGLSSARSWTRRKSTIISEGQY